MNGEVHSAETQQYARVLYESGELNMREIGDLLGISKNTVSGWSLRQDWAKRERMGVGVLTVEEIEEARELYEEDGLTMEQIAAHFGGDCTKNVIVGHAVRGNWVKAGWLVQTLFQRMDELEARMERVLKETSGNYYYTPRKKERADAQV